MKDQESDGSEPPGEATAGSAETGSSSSEHREAHCEDEVPSRGSSPCSSELAQESSGGQCPSVPSLTQPGVSYRCLLRQNQVLLTALEELQSRCANLKRENSLLRKSCFPETQEKVRHLKRKNAELAVIAKRLEERARKLQEANLKVVSTPMAVKGPCAGLCKKALARQRVMDLREQAGVLLAKDKQINALQRECQELRAKVPAGKEEPSRLLDFHQLLRESQKEVLRLQRQIALKSFKGQAGPKADKPIPVGPTKVWGPQRRARIEPCSNGLLPSRTTRRSLPTHKPVSLPNDGEESRLPIKRGVLASPAPEIKQQIQRLESELRKKRKQCETLEHEVRKKHKRYAELETQLQEVASENVRLSEENAQLQGQVEWIEKVESENADLRLRVSEVTEERDSALQKTQELEHRLESLGQALQHMRDVAERRQQLEHDHEKALLALQKKKEEIKELQQAQVEARKEHEGAVQLLEGSLDCMQARVQELENQCRNHTEQFNFLCQELKRFRFQTGKIGHPPHASSPSTTMVMSEVTLASCSPSPSPTQHPDHGVKEKDRVLLSGSSSRFGQKIQSEDVEEAPPPGLWLPEHPIGCVVARSPDMLILPVTNRKPSKKVESQSSSSRSESIPTTSPKSCPTPEVDTASEMEELDIDSVSLIPDSESHRVGKLHVFLARYSYNPFDGPNENPEAELPLTAGEYIYVYGEMDDDGFFEGELMDGRRGLVPSNFVERVSDDDLVTFLPGEFSDLSQSSPLDRSFLSSGERSDPSTDDPNTVPLRLEGDPKDRETPNPEVPYPRKVTLIREFGSGLVVGWDPPFPSTGCPEVQSYQVFVDTELRQNVKAGGQTKAVLEKLDLRTKAYRISVQSVSEKGTSDCFRCTFLVGKDFPLAPIDLLVRNVEATSVELSWAPSNSNFSHVVYLNGEEHGVTKPGVYWYTFRSLKPNTSYAATVEVQPQWTFWESGQERQDQELFSAEIHFTTALAGSPDAPLDVRVEPGPSPGILIISWLPVTIDAEGSSNGVRVTGYALYADGQKVMEVTSPTAGSVLADISQLQMLQMCREVSVRTVSLYGESSDSVPAQIPSALLKDPSGPSSLPETSCFTSQISCGRDPISPVAKSKPNESEKLAISSFGETSQNELTALIVTHKLHSETPGTDSLPEAGRDGLVVSPGCNVTRKEPEEGHQEESAHQARDLEISGASGAPDVSMGEKPKDSAEKKEASSGSGTPSDRRAPEPGISGRAKLSKDAISKDEPTVLVTKTRREQGEKRSDPGNRPLNLLTDHPRNSDLSDIMEEEEEEEEEDHRPKWKPSESHNRENGEKFDSDGDSDEEVLERILEAAPLPKNHSKALFSIPEVTEEEEEEEDWARREPSPVKKANNQTETRTKSRLKKCGGLSGYGHTFGMRKDELSWECREEHTGFGNDKSRSKQEWKASPDRSRGTIGGGLYRAHSLKENLDVITNLEPESEMCGWKSVRRRRMMPQEPVRRFCLSPESLEIDVEYDSEEDPTIMSTPVTNLSSADGSPTDCEEEWSDSSESVPSSAPKELKRCSSWDADERTEARKGSPGHSPRWRKQTTGAAVEERSRSLERSPSLWRALTEHKDPPPNWEVRDVETEQLNSKSWRAPTRRGRRSRRKSREELAPSGSWRSSSPETMDEEDSLRLFVALFDYDPVSMSPNSDAAEEELPFQEGQILKVYGHKDADGFYRGECAGRIGYIPCNMVSEVQVDSQSARTQLLQDGRISTGMLVEHLDNGAFSPPRRPPRAHPPKPRRSKKERKKQGTEGPGLGAHEIQDLSSEEDVPRTMVAIFDYNPQENSPNPDTEAELRFSAGDVVTVLSSMDDDGFYYAEINGQKGLVPSNFLEGVGSDGVCPGGVTLGRQGKQLS
ncbi:peripheral-type benzodiazepine receptor-associated protein 1 isoform X3 [Anolis sagrei]|uniref:peripheral-type benzodiazepine receptor-associated protein 1 isoform X3 n=1 Tax=Anolis sagrei TaxID=38937 RepID=UPI0035220996